ncbi:MAG: putative CRISPR-associated protein [Calditrichaeota bacterium]|nr:putative CRISPR-associated protein [Calditrichota bacterium]
MATFILSTVGTSLLSKIRRQRNLSEDTLPEPQSILAELNSLAPSDERAGAEVNSLASLLQSGRVGRQKIRDPISMVFLVSDTPDGRWTGKLLADFWSDARRGIRVDGVDFKVVPGLQHNDPQRFAREGLRNLVRIASQLLPRPEASLRIINATGGYKAQISFAGLIGQALAVPVVYQFEKFGFCIEMPPMPVDFSRDLWLEHYDLFCRLSENSLIKSELDLRDADSRFVELLDEVEIDGEAYVALSPILELMHQGFLVRPWPQGVRQPPASVKSIPDKIAIQEAELSHAPARTRGLIEQLSRQEWITLVSSIKDADTRRSRVINRKDPDRPDEIQFYWSDSDYSRVLAIRTTAEDDGHRTWCANELSREFLNR